MALSVRSRKFCCCLPVRLGTIVLALLAMIGGTFVAGVGFIQIGGLRQRHVEKSDQVALWIQAIMYSILGIVGVFGFIGALIKNRRMISSFAFVLAIHLGFSIASGVFSIYVMFTRDSSTTVNECVANAANQGVTVSESECHKGIVFMKGVMVGIYVLTWLIQLYAYFIVERYADQLDEESMSKHRVIPRTLPEISRPHMAQYPGLPGRDDSSYPFADPHQAFGHSARRDQAHMV